MADTYSFDIACKIDAQELDNAVNQTLKEVSQRYDLKDANASLNIKPKDNKLECTAADEHKLKLVIDIFKQKLVKRNISPKAVTFDDIKPALGQTAKCEASLQNGIPKDKAKDIVKDLKVFNAKLQSQIQDDQIRISSKKIDELQAAISFLKEKDYGIHMQFLNYR